MIAFPEDARERELRLLIARAQYERHVSNETSALVEHTLNDVLDRMMGREFRDLTAPQKARLNTLYRELDRIIHEGYTKVSVDLTKRMELYAQVESDIARASVNAVLSTGTGEIAVSFYRLPKAYLTSIAKLPIQGLNIGQWFEAQAQTMSVNTRRIIQQGMIEGKGVAEISRRILAPDKAAVTASGVPLSRRAKNEARIIARTTVNAVQNDATKVSNAALPRSVSDSYMWMSVHDSRTSQICISLDGRVWKYDDPSGRIPPAHPNCRSTTRALIRGADVSLTDQKKPATMRSYSDWLTTQPQSVQNEILGSTRAGFWRDGKMSLADAIDQDNRVLTLDELRRKLFPSGIPAAVGAP